MNTASCPSAVFQLVRVFPAQRRSQKRRSLESCVASSAEATHKALCRGLQLRSTVLVLSRTRKRGPRIASSSPQCSDLQESTPLDRVKTAPERCGQNLVHSTGLRTNKPTRPHEPSRITAHTAASSSCKLTFFQVQGRMWNLDSSAYFVRRCISDITTTILVYARV